MPVVRAEGVAIEGPRNAKEASADTEAERPALDLGALFDAHAPFMVRVLTRMVGTSDRAEDVVQRAFLIAHRKGLPGSDVDHARAWLYRVAMNEVRHERRSMARRMKLAARVEREPPLSDAAGPQEKLEVSTQAAAVRAVVARLPEAQREVFVLYELEELTGTEIAELIDIPENTVWSRLRLARSRFRKLWAAHEERNS